MKLRRLFAACVAAACFPLLASAIPADPKPMQVRQPDGTVLTMLLRGDEHGYMMFTDDGVPLYRNGDTGVYEYARLSGGMLAGSGIAAADAARRDGRAKAYVAGMDIDAMTRSVSEARKARLASPTVSRVRTNNFPCEGSPKCLVILMDFTDRPFSVADPQQLFSAMLNEEGFTHENGANGSVRDFYKASSSGKFTPEFVVVGPVHLDNTYSYYGQDYPTFIDRMFTESIREACKKLDDDVDFSEFDIDKDGYVDNIYFYYAGYGQADTGVSDYIWPHSANYEDFGKELILDGVRVNRYSCGNELRGYTTEVNGIGTFVHEFGHVLGLADHYATDSYVLSMQLDPGYWDTMASGSYNNNMNTPPLFSAFERAELGWLEYTEIDTSVKKDVTLPCLGDENMAYRVKVPDSENEYFIMENRQQKGWDEYLPGHGMLLWHIDMNESLWISNKVNNDPFHQRVDLVEADGMTGYANGSGDSYPGTSGRRSVDLTSWFLVNIMKVSNIVEEDGLISMSLEGSDYKMPALEGLEVADVTDEGFTLSWPSAAGRTYTLTILKDGTALPGYDGLEIGDVVQYTVTGLEASTVYTVELRYSENGYESYPATTEVTTAELTFARDAPAGLNAVNVTSTGFTATWNEMSRADNYLISLTKHNYSQQSETMGHDFADRQNNLPDGWLTNCTAGNSSIGWFGEDAPSLRMSTDGTYLVMDFNGMRVDRLSLWCRSSKEGNRLRLEIDNGTGWNTLTTLDVPTTGEVLDVDVEREGKLQLVFERASGYITIDDVYADCRSVERTPVSGLQDVTTGGKAEYTFTSLEPDGVYGFSVKGVNGSEQSAASAELSVQLGSSSGIAAPETAEDDGPAAVYDLQGRRVSPDALPRGIYIIKKGGQPARKIVVR